MSSYKSIESIKNQYESCFCTKEFLAKYLNFPYERDTLNNWKWAGKDLGRVISLLEFEDYSKKYKKDFQVKTLLGFNAENDPELNFINFKNFTNIDYDQDLIKHDLHNLDIEEKEYEFVLLNQTVEHLYNPFKCLRNIYRYMKFGSFIYITVPIINIPHNYPNHFYSGLTPIGLAMMLQHTGYKILELGQWGNKEYTLELFNTLSWPDINRIKNPGLNQLEYPIIAWALAKKF